MFLSVLILFYQTLLRMLYTIPCLGQIGCSGDLAGVLSLPIPLTHIQQSLAIQRGVAAGAGRADSHSSLQAHLSSHSAAGKGEECPS